VNLKVVLNREGHNGGGGRRARDPVQLKGLHRRRGSKAIVSIQISLVGKAYRKSLAGSDEVEVETSHRRLQERNTADPIRNHPLNGGDSSTGKNRPGDGQQTNQTSKTAQRKLPLHGVIT